MTSQLGKGLSPLIFGHKTPGMPTNRLRFLQLTLYLARTAPENMASNLHENVSVNGWEAICGRKPKYLHSLLHSRL